MTWGSAPAFSLGVEEELFLVDRETLETAPVFEQVVPEPDERLKPELFACIVETTTPICRDADELLGHLVALRRELIGRGATIVAAGTHPLARGEGQPIVPLPRYRRLREKLGDRLSTQLVCGLHVHVAMPDAETALRAFEGVVPWLPVLLALSANSPYSEGRATGLRSTRAERLLEMPTGGTPPLLPDWAAWEEATAGDDTRRHWDAWPRPEYGTLEMRVMDQQTDVSRSAGFAALVQALVQAVADSTSEQYDRELYASRRAVAARVPPDPA
ncbi:MAG TPA: YbdK family carboxylate-amine ligase, partial [Gaiellaceae bacterium]|nr:YbdK family carboxylate-amine ligase [Gaiellaceae bacterium]